MGQNAEVMPRPLNLSIVIHSLEVRTIFYLFVLEKHMLRFAQIISVFRTGRSFARVGVGYPEHVAVRRSVNVGLVHSKWISNDQELIQSDPTSCPQNQNGNN